MSKKPDVAETDPPSLAYADEWVDKLRSHLPETVKSWDAEAVHQSRVATRRLRAAVDVLRPVLSDDHRKAFNQVLRKLRRQLGPIRDADVMLDHLDKFGTGPGVAWVRQQITDDRDELRKHAADKLKPAKALAKLGCWWGVRQEWVEAGHAVDGLLANAVHLQLDAFVERAADAGGDAHELRIAGKALRYTLEMAVAAGHPLPAAVAKAFKRMQDALGAWHDMVVLADRTLCLALSAQLAFHDAPTMLAVTDVAKLALQRSSKHLAAFRTIWRDHSDTLADAIRSAFPLSKPASGPKTGRGPAGSAGMPDPVPPPQVDPVAG